VGYKAHQHAWLDGLICVNHAQTNRLKGYKGLAQTIPNWMPLAPAPAPATSGIRGELGLSEKTFLVGAVGRLHPSKGMDVLIPAFRASAPADAALVILGEGPQRKELERLCAGDSRIHLPGYRAAVHDCLRDVDLFVSPSREESFGLAIIEAMSTGAPIVATAAEGPGEFLRDHPVALVAPGSTESLAAEIGHAYQQYSNGTLRRIDYDLSMFDPSARVANIMDFYGQVIEAGQWSPARRPASRVAFAT
jgi:glycosyltransferase involved in cell wall biosynthesis